MSSRGCTPRLRSAECTSQPDIDADLPDLVRRIARRVRGALRRSRSALRKPDLRRSVDRQTARRARRSQSKRCTRRASIIAPRVTLRRHR